MAKAAGPRQRKAWSCATDYLELPCWAKVRTPAAHKERYNRIVSTFPADRPFTGRSIDYGRYALCTSALPHGLFAAGRRLRNLAAHECRCGAEDACRRHDRPWQSFWRGAVL